MGTLKIKVIGSIKKNKKDVYLFPAIFGKGRDAVYGFYKQMPYEQKHDPDPVEPTPFYRSPGAHREIWVFKFKTFLVENAHSVPYDEIVLRIKHLAYKTDKALDKIKKEVQAFENFEKLPTARLELIPESVRLFVWQRDEGKCAKCGSKERLEFDHIIPVTKGGSNTERNIQLLCEKHNRKKGKNL